jgi:hypothetical protein
MLKIKSGFLISTCYFLTFYFLLSANAQESFKYDAKGERNPFMPLVTSDGRLLQLDKSEKKTEIAIEGIIFDPYGVSYAIVNGAVVNVGDFVGNKQVLKIEKDKLFFVEEGQVSELELKKEE